ncbi:MAG: Glutamyl-tRNA(Gln) amidotransferase, C subunit [uncultured bacterium]|nr:MAG: Glutamyl-tRNA(Gln) amidotransferase, C subunit [uncultured bacterium]OFW69878.1 MAG: asparaginyl/glutamyl-tRNA amidotransferase subunit C [Alphaproteobacteria bacterium GWC2_42_16]OFW73089.1 MAG: asparaginyl/glutamyl-tRNA amidotransferase subunit C [Alphaproteobacteria bacterium GWA2_41_27]OFW81663.1 MAG: asparaginyl/glutamyl-tRNA amidotransferase subunit C [Alphaproteobacteria bacterium RIFCSPHIGHO2_12_FULL_42_100]OFW85305.1 MAG: asparaginyl/glutamyl-tRNA amidotransferase subunit C [Al
MSLDHNTVKRIARLARLKLPEERIKPTQEDLNHILHFIDQLNEVETSGVEPMAGVNITSMPMRKDVVTAENMVDKILKNAPDIACNMFVVPKVVE